MDLEAIYRDRFNRTGIEKRKRVWRVLCSSYFNKLIGPGRDVLDLGAGYGEFINNIAARHKYALDLNPESEARLHHGVRFLLSGADRISLDDGSVDVVFASNFLEHLPDKQTCHRVFAEAHRVLRPQGRFIVMGPNIRFAYREYWDWFDHFLPLSDRSACEGLRQSGFRIVKSTPRFLPVTMESRLPVSHWLIRLYLAMPIFWLILGKQFLIVAERI